MPPEQEETAVEAPLENIAEELTEQTAEAASPEDEVEAAFEDVYEDDQAEADEESPVVEAAAEDLESDPAPDKEKPPVSAPSEEEKPEAAAVDTQEPAAEPPEEKTPAKSQEEIRTGLVAEITERYKFSQEEAELLATEPEKVLPKMAGEMFVDVYEAVYYGLFSQLPQVIRSVLQKDTESTKYQDSFFSEFSELNDEKYAEQLSQIATLWRSQNKDATNEQAIDGIGKAAMAMLGLSKAAVEEVQPTAAKPKMPSIPAAAAVSSGEIKPKVPDEVKSILDIMDFEIPDS